MTSAPARNPRVAPLRILVVGGGIGGLAAAIALLRDGHDVSLVEQAKELAAVGHGITLWSNATLVLREFGLEAALLAAGSVMETGELRDCHGRVLVRTPVGEVARELSAPCLGIARADLQAALLAAVPAERISVGARCVSVRNDAESAVATLADGTERSADLVVLADGIRSSLRDGLFGPRKVRYAGYNCWRALTTFDHPMIRPGAAFESWGPGTRFGLVGIARHRVYWFCSVTTPPGGRDDDAAAAVLGHVGSWHAPIPELVRATRRDAIQRLDIHDCPPERPWFQGRAVLLGDAAHATTPNLGHGACLAIEDAWVLARSLRTRTRLPDALAAYEGARHRRTLAITLRSRRLGWMGQLASPLLGRIRNACMAATPDSWMRRAFSGNLRFEP